MSRSFKSNNQIVNNKPSTESSSWDTVSCNLWVGNLSPDVSDSDLRNLFAKHGFVENIVCYSSRNYAFVYFKGAEDAKRARDSLQGFILRGNPLKIDFAKPFDDDLIDNPFSHAELVQGMILNAELVMICGVVAMELVIPVLLGFNGGALLKHALLLQMWSIAKPCKSLWVSGISTSVSKEDLEADFSKFGKIEDFKYHWDKNTAYIDYCRLEDASKALKAMNGKQKGGTVIRVDYLRSNPRRAIKDKRAFIVLGLDKFILDNKGFHLNALFNSNQIVNYAHQFVLHDQGPDFNESKEGQHFRSMGLVSPWLPQDPVRNYTDPLHYGSNRSQPVMPSEGRKGDGEQPSKVLLISYPPVVHIDEQMLHNAMILFGEIERIRSFPSRYCSFVEFRSVEEAQLAKEGLQGKLFNDSRISITFSINDLALNQHPNGFPPGIGGPRPDAFFNEMPFQAPQLDAIGQPMVRPFAPHGIGGPVTSMRPFAPSGSFVPPILPGPEFGVSEPNSTNPIGGHNWRSSPSNGMLSSPSVSINPSTKPTPGSWDVYDSNQIQREPKRLRTGNAAPFKETNDRVLPTDQICRGPLEHKTDKWKSRIGRPHVDYLWRGVIAKGGIPVCHARCVPVGDWIGYEIPEIVNCSARTGLDLLSKHYADAIGFDISFFLPDSEEDFASYTELLRYLGDHNRAGVAKFDDGTTLFLVPPSEFLTTVLKVSGPERLYGVVLKFPQHASDSKSGPSLSHPQHIDKPHGPPQNKHDVVLHDEKIPQNTYNAPYVVPPVTSTCTTQAGLSLTPELVATLASLTKINSNGLQPAANTVIGGPLVSSVASDERQFQGRNDYETSNLAGPYVQQVGSPFQSQAYPSNAVGDPNFSVTHKSHNQGLSFNHQTPQGVQFGLPNMQAAQQYQLDYSQDMRTDSGFQKNADASPLMHPGVNAVTSSGQVYGTNFYEPHNMVPPGVENSGMHLPEQMQQPVAPFHGAGQQTMDAEKNERYQSTLQFAANLLLQIHQKRPGAEAGGTDGKN
ncbi:LOW QUALITY PROTEIN: hypothetical protein OSB04_013314 [Centaurea solstitialis]|uniref:RRM domain-containing protein n=1 Tax=Centaurea solstitialis TaxID=347529 RepID=A0AA38TPQ3_9ASTR|nr:LOW QUALITY PROTEIN: hypothetical protein OSB04_013314 [Centaurea solstitialis]